MRPRRNEPLDGLESGEIEIFSFDELGASLLANLEHDERVRAVRLPGGMVALCAARPEARRARTF